MDWLSRVSCGDQKRSAIAARRGHIRDSIVSGVTNSDHMQASPPRMRFCSSAESAAAAPGFVIVIVIGSTA